jgi:hypothetical protein
MKSESMAGKMFLRMPIGMANTISQVAYLTRLSEQEVARRLIKQSIRWETIKDMAAARARP